MSDFRLVRILRCIAPAAATATLAPAPVRAQADTGARIDAVDPHVIAWRRHIHQYPELSFREHKAAADLADALRSMPGVTVQTGVGKTGVKAGLAGQGDRRDARVRARRARRDGVHDDGAVTARRQ